MARHYRKYSNEDIKKAASEVKSIAGLLKKLGLQAAGGNYAHMKRKLQKLNIDCHHWTGQAWSKGEQLKDWSQYTRASRLKPHLIKKRGHQCERCGRKNWQGETITLEVHHVNGNHPDNREENLKLYCPNCHALTPTWRRQKKKHS